MVCANFLYINICISCYLRVENNPLELVGACTQYHTPLHHDGYAVDCASNKKNGQQKLSVKVGHCIEISNPFLKDFEVVILFVEWIDEKVPNYR